MTNEYKALSPRQTFDDNMRPAHLLLDIYRLLDCNDQILTEGEMVEALRGVIRGSADEDLMLVYNELFMGLIRERAHLPRSALRQATLSHLLRQAVVAACTALDTYLPALLRANLPVVIKAKRRDFVPRGDNTLDEYFRHLQFTLDETLRLLDDESAPEFIAGKILNLTNFSYLSNRRGVHVTGALLGLDKPWDEIAAHLKRDKKELTRILEETENRRNDIVHRADRARTNPGGPPQAIHLSETQQAVDTINHICLALDELVAERMAQIRALMPE